MLISELPIRIKELALKEQERCFGYKNDTIDLWVAFSFVKSLEGPEFWEDIYDLNFKPFYKKYGEDSEPKQETLEEAAENMWLDPIKNLTSKMSFIQGAKWQQEKMYSEEEVLELLRKSHNAESTSIISDTLKKWFEQFKKK